MLCAYVCGEVEMATRVGRWVSAAVLCGVCAGFASAQADGSAGQAAESMQSSGEMAAAAQMPVARLSHLAGSVTVGAADGTEAPVDAALNMPLVAGTRLSTGDAGEAEVEFADGSVLRMTPGSVATIARMDAAQTGTQIELGNGLFYLELRASDRGTFSVFAGEVTLAPEENAGFRVRVQDGQVEAAVLSGSVSMTRANAYTAQIGAGESVRTDPKNGRRYLLAETVSPERWDGWNERLAQAAQDEQAARTSARDSYAGEQGYGWADLDAQGRWYDVAGEGTVWQPAGADAGFDPYSNGSWVYGPGGYTFASGYGWGWLPYRCGAWSFYGGFGWGWVPSSSCLSFGFGGGVDSGFASGGVRVRRPPTGWRPPVRPGFDQFARDRRHVPVPVRYQPIAPGVALTARRRGEPVRIDGAVATPLPRVGHGVTPQGGSAVGSSLLRDFPMRGGTHEPVLGVVSRAPPAVPGRPAVWHRERAQGGEGAGPASPRGTSGGGVGFVNGRGVGVGGAASGQGNTYGQGRLLQPTDPPVGANGAPPVGANGAPPVNANGAPPFGASGLSSDSGTSQGEVFLHRGQVGEDSHRLVSPLRPRLVPSPVQGNGIVPTQRPAGTAPRPAPRTSMPTGSPAPRTPMPTASPAPRMMVPSPPPAPRVAPAPVAPAAATSPVRAQPK